MQSKILAKGYFASIHTDLKYYFSTFSTVKILSKYGTILSKQSMVIILRILPGYFHSTSQAILCLAPSDGHFKASNNAILSTFLSLT
jgi:hypothetical protein